MNTAAILTVLMASSLVCMACMIAETGCGEKSSGDTPDGWRAWGVGTTKGGAAANPHGTSIDRHKYTNDRLWYNAVVKFIL